MDFRNATGLWTGAALSSTPNYIAGAKGENKIAKHDRDILRSLAEKVASHAEEPIQKERRDLWTAHNDLKRTRPLVFCDPENGWNEIITEDQIRCDASLAKRWEVVLRKEIFWAEQMKDDKVIEPFFDVGYTHSADDWGVETHQIGGNGGAFVWEPALKAETDIDKLHAPLFEVDYETTEETANLAEDVLGDLLAVRRIGVWWWSFQISFMLSLWRGLQQIMLDMIDRPAMTHRLMAILRDGYLHKLDYLESLNSLSLNTDRYVGSGGFGYTDQLPGSDYEGPVKASDMWGHNESQETIGVSPDMFAEFIFPYQLPIMRRFGLNCYGCCEPLDARWHIVKEAPNLRRVSVSAWANLEKMASFLEDRYIFSWKPAPADLAEPQIDENRIRTEIRRALEITRGCNMEILMKDNHTLGNNPHNAVRWVQIAKEEAERISG